MNLSGLSIRTKLTAIILIAVLPSVLLFFVFIMYTASDFLTQKAVDETKTLVRAHNQDFIKILLVNTPDIAADTVSRLTQFKQIKDVILYDKKNRISFVYQKNDRKLPSFQNTKDIWFDNNELHIKNPLKHGNKQYGSVYVRVSLEQLTVVLNDFYQASIIMIPFIFIISFISALFFQRSFSKPIIALSDAMLKITNNKDYSVRMPTINSKEMKALYSGFNNMLNIIQQNFTIIKKDEAQLIHAQKIAHLGYWEHNPLDNTMMVSDGFREILNIQNEKDISLSYVLSFLAPPNKRDLLRLMSYTNITGKPGNTELTFHMDNDKELYMYITIESKFNETLNKNVLTGIIQNVTERHLKEVHTQFAQIEKEKADSANNAKSAFLANMSHELRTPLNAIIGYSEMLIEDAEEQGSETTLKDLTKITNSGQHLLALINDILDLSKIEAGKINLVNEEFDPHIVIKDIVDTLTPMLQKNDNELLVQCEDNLGTLHADSVKLKQVLLNLLSNACKFTEKGKITIRAYQERNHNKLWIMFEIIDTGIGIKSSQIKKLFKAFSQADISTFNKYGGTGLGLVISQKLCVMMGGDITVKSDYGKGTSFTVKLPIHHS